MTTGRHLKARLRWLGIRPCQRCRALARKMDAEGPDWCERNIDLLTTQIGRNLRGHKQARARLALLIPAAIRKRWIRRQITLAIKRARKDNDDANNRA